MTNRLMKTLVFVCFVLQFLLISGCSKKPEGFPKVVPCKITIKCEGQPVHSTDIQLVPKEAMAFPCIIRGVTDDNGTAVISTTKGTYTKKGAPKGDFLVTLHESSRLSPELVAERAAIRQEAVLIEWTEEHQEEIEAAENAMVVPMYYGTPETTTLEFSVNGKTEQSFEIECMDDAEREQKRRIKNMFH